jgi:hypothetical protein
VINAQAVVLVIADKSWSFMFKTSFISLLILTSILTTAQITTDKYKSVHQTNSQLTVIPIPNPVPSIGNLTGAGKTYTPVVYNNKMIRCTDINTDPTNTAKYSYEVTDSGGASDKQWNLNHTLLRVVRAGTGSTGVLGFNQTTSTCTKINPKSIVATGATWSGKNPNIDFVMEGTQVLQRTFNYLNPMQAPTTKALFDFKSCLGLNTIKVTWRSSINTFQDRLMVAAFSDRGDQNTGEYVAVYNIPTKQCSVYNTLTGKVNGTYGTKGQVSTFYPYAIHDVSISEGGVILVSVAANSCPSCPKLYGNFLYWPGTTKVNLITIGSGGHEAMGFKTYINFSDVPAVASRLITNLTTVREITSASNVHLPGNQESHIAWENVNQLDTNPFFSTQASLGLTQPIQITTPLQQELWAANPTTGAFIRIAPTMSSGQTNSFNFRTSQAIFSVDPTGTDIALSTDWEGTFGNTDGKTATCILGTKPPTECRSDVVIVIPR